MEQSADMLILNVFYNIKILFYSYVIMQLFKFRFLQERMHREDIISELHKIASQLVSHFIVHCLLSYMVSYCLF